jgi:tRNA threonylcarbamoyladenosine modification (KEOPS) complex  Pcc1 subunit
VYKIKGSISFNEVHTAYVMYNSTNLENNGYIKADLKQNCIEFYLEGNDLNKLSNTLNDYFSSLEMVEKIISSISGI